MKTIEGRDARFNVAEVTSVDSVECMGSVLVKVLVFVTAVVLAAF